MHLYTTDNLVIIILKIYINYIIHFFLIYMKYPINIYKKKTDKKIIYTFNC